MKKIYFTAIFLFVLFLAACTSKEQQSLNEIETQIGEVEELSDSTREESENQASPSPQGINLAEKCSNILTEAKKYFKIDFEENEAARHLGSCSFNAFDNEIYSSKIATLKIQKECYLNRDQDWSKYKEDTIKSSKLNEVTGPAATGISDYFYSFNDNSAQHYESPVSLYFKDPADGCAYTITGGIQFAQANIASDDAIANFKYLVPVIIN